jgi:hypothetical protein
MMAARDERNRSSTQAGFISQLCRGQHSGLRPTFAPSSFGSAGHFGLQALMSDAAVF